MPERIVQLNEEVIKGQIKELVRGSCHKIVRLYNEIVELMLSARYSISPFNSVPIMHISKCDFVTFWHIHSDNLLLQSAVSRFWGIPPCELRKNLREAPRRSLYKLSVGILPPLGATA